MPDNYYDELLAGIRKNMEQGRYDSANAMIEEELSMPYVPSKVLTELNELKKELKPYLSKEKEMKIMSPEEVSKALEKGGEAVFRALRTLDNSNIRNYLDVIQEYLLDDMADRLVVSMLIEACQKQQVSTPLSYYHRGERHIVVPSQLKGMFADEAVNEAYSMMVRILESQNPSFLKQCEQVLVQYVSLNYPQKITVSGEDLAYSVIRYVYLAYDDEEGFDEFARAQQISLENLVDIII